MNKIENMKQVLKLTLWLLLLPMAMQAQDRTSIDKIEAIAQNLYLKEIGRAHV